MKIVKPSVELLSHTPGPEKLIELAGRTCYKSEDRITEGSAKKFVQMIIKRGHESVLEHASATLKFIVDRGVSHELVRHRIMSISQESTRYCSYDKEIKFILPDEIKNNITAKHALKEIEFCYKVLLKYFKPEIARAILPNCTKTELVVTANFREWRHILKLRTSKAAHPQIREVMNQAKELLIEVSETVFKGVL